MAQEKLQKAVEAWNGLSAEQKQGIWNGAVERLSKIDVTELSIPEQVTTDGGFPWIEMLWHFSAPHYIGNHQEMA